jgi:hypothetical protein
VKVCEGYYGQELSGVDLVTNEFQDDVEKCFRLSGQDRIKFVLGREYNGILKTLNDKTFVETIVSGNRLILGNLEYRKRINSGIYSELKTPVGIYIRDYDHYRLVDGYHRYLDLVEGNDEESFLIISAE